MKKYLPNLSSSRTLYKFLFPAFVIVAILNFTLVPYFFGNANAGTLTLAKLTISDSRASGAGGGTGVSYAFAFTLTASTSVKQWTIKLCTSSDTTSCTTPTGIVTTAAVRSSDNFSGTGRTDTFTSNGTLTTVITTPATESPTAKTVTYTGITNPTTQNTSFYAQITTYSDTGSTSIDGPTSVAAATLSNAGITAAASVDSTFTFSVAGTASGTTTAGNQTTDITSTATTIPFGTLTAGTTKSAAQDLTIATNAANGYTVTLAAADPPLTDGTKNIDKFSAGSNAAPAAWVGGTTNNPTGTTPSVNTGFFGYTTNDSSLGTGTATRFTSSNNFWAGSDIQTANEVAFNGGSTSGAGDSVRVGYRVEVNAFQPNGNYTGVITLVATPTF